MTGAVPHPTLLRGSLLTLEPLEESHIEPLMAISTAHADVYRYTSTPVNEEQAQRYFTTAFSEREAGRAYPFAILDQRTGEVIGSTRLADIRWNHRNCELGYTWFHPDRFGTGVNVESKLLMLTLAFDTLDLIRVQIHTDARNIRSQRAIRSLGAQEEGVLRRHMIAKDGYVRDTMVFSVVDLEWPRVRFGLIERLGAWGIEANVEVLGPPGSQAAPGRSSDGR